MWAAMKSLGNIVGSYNQKFDNACLSLETRVCGKPINDILDTVDTKVVEATKVVIVKTAKVADTPFQKVKAVLPKKMPKVKAIPITMKCSSCGETIPKEAHFCPMCKTQLVIPIAKLSTSPLAVKVLGMPASDKTPGKPSLKSKIVKAFQVKGTPLVKVREPIKENTPTLKQ